MCVCIYIIDEEKNLPVNNKTDWPKIPQIPQVPVMSNIPNANSFNNVNSNTPFNDLAYKLDQVLGKMQSCQFIAAFSYSQLTHFFFNLQSSCRRRPVKYPNCETQSK